MKTKILMIALALSSGVMADDEYRYASCYMRIHVDSGFETFWCMEMEKGKRPPQRHIEYITENCIKSKTQYDILYICPTSKIKNT